ncbi:MAG: lytic transglycosylase domain-containing protein [Blastochloris viridis]|uniref:Lytic transglycosylase domain-containing protein n=1 Tax=Blastochloris viridis TaxID=1079 RepID=A0A6N4R9D5_BLAVI|nr:MAG: lytic transglycosylase domain-containing protein [Blastochloris viridis]
MIRWSLLAALLVVPVGYADMQGGTANDQSLAAIEPAAGDEDAPSSDLLGERAEQIKDEVRDELADGEGVTGKEAIVAPVAKAQKTEKTETRAVSASGMKVLSNSDAKAYREAMSRARRGEFPNLKVEDNLLLGEVRGLYLMNKRGATFSELNGWLKDYRDLPMAAAVYDEALAKRATPKRVCKTKQVTKKVKDKKTGKMVSKKVDQQSCSIQGEYGPMPVKTLVMEKREATRAAQEAARAGDLAKLPAAGRAALGQSWRLRGQGKYGEASDVMLQSGVRSAAGDDKWQGELVRIADFYHGKRMWKEMVRVAEPASTAKGPNRDDARWLAGYGHYMLGNKTAAAEQWSQLVREEPATGTHSARAAFWGARVHSELKQDSRAKALLEAGARDPLSFYGQLSAAKLGKAQRLDWDVPHVDARGFDQLTRVKAARRGLALAQIGEVDMAQRQLRAAYEDLPYQATRTLAAAAVRMGLPATALYAGKQLKEEGTVMPAALFPLAEEWSPKGGWTYDRPLMVGIMRQESAFNPQIGSRVGAQGLMQLMPATAKYIAKLSGKSLPARADLHDPETNLGLAQDYLHYLNNKLDGNQLLVVAAYNGGIGNVRRWLERGVTPGHDPMLWLESIPFDETRDYVEKVFANYWLYQQRMKQTPWSLAALADGYWPLQYNGNRKTALK